MIIGINAPLGVGGGAIVVVFDVIEVEIVETVESDVTNVVCVDTVETTVLVTVVLTTVGDALRIVERACTFPGGAEND
jgi:hypothetical protein